MSENKKNQQNEKTANKKVERPGRTTDHSSITIFQENDPLTNQVRTIQQLITQREEASSKKHGHTNEKNTK